MDTEGIVVNLKRREYYNEWRVCSVNASRDLRQ